MAAFYVDDEEVWKCLKHPSKRRRTGICPTCLRDRLATLCPDCGNERPCDCGSAAGAEPVSSSSSSSSFSIFGRSYSRSVAAAAAAGIGAVDSESNVNDNEPSMRRARSVAVPFLSRLSASVRGGRSVSATPSAPATDVEQKEDVAAAPVKVRRKKSSIFSIFKSSSKSKKGGKRKDDANRTDDGEDGDDMSNKENEDVYAKIRMMRSRSVAVPIYSDSADAAGEVRSSPSPAKGRGWHFPSPIKAFRQSTKSPRVLQERSPVYR